MNDANWCACQVTVCWPCNFFIPAIIARKYSQNSEAENILVWSSNNNEYTHTRTNRGLLCWWVKCVSPVPMHTVGVPYRVPSPQDQDSLRVLQYVEKQLAHFNPARSISHQCKLHKPILWPYLLKNLSRFVSKCQMHALLFILLVVSFWLFIPLSFVLACFSALKFSSHWISSSSDVIQ